MKRQAEKSASCVINNAAWRNQSAKMAKAAKHGIAWRNEMQGVKKYNMKSNNK